MASQTGIPAIERWIGRLLINRWRHRNPASSSMVLLRRQQRELIELIESAGTRAGQPVQIRRLPGLEAGSTNYSLAMVADHLARVNSGIAAMLSDLIADRRHERIVVIADYKPDPMATPGDALRDLDRSIEELDPVLAEIPAIVRSTATHAHHWFGELPASTWACFPPFHQAIHLKQARAIASGL